MAILAGLICAPRTIKGLGVMEGLKGKNGEVLLEKDFDFYNRSDKPKVQKELTADDFMRVLSRKKP